MKFYSTSVFVFILQHYCFGQINEQNQEGLLDSIENPEIMRVLDLDSISLQNRVKCAREVYWAIIDSSLHETTNQEDQELF
jgi:hypothetical protein